MVVLFAAYALKQKIGADGGVVVAPNISPASEVTQTLLSSPKTDSIKNSPSPKASSQPALGRYKDGQYTGDVTDAYYGNVQVKAIITGGKITDVQFLQYPHDRGTSIRINSQAMPYLTQEAVSAQSASVDIISGATQTSLAFQKSLASALSQAK